MSKMRFSVLFGGVFDPKIGPKLAKLRKFDKFEFFEFVAGIHTCFLSNFVKNRDFLTFFDIFCHFLSKMRFSCVKTDPKIRQIWCFSCFSRFRTFAFFGTFQALLFVTFLQKPPSRAPRDPQFRKIFDFRPCFLMQICANLGFVKKHVWFQGVFGGSKSRFFVTSKKCLLQSGFWGGKLCTICGSDGRNTQIGTPNLGSKLNCKVRKIA